MLKEEEAMPCGDRTKSVKRRKPHEFHAYEIVLTG